MAGPWFIDETVDLSSALVGQYDLTLANISTFIAIIAVYASLAFAKRAAISPTNLAKSTWLLLGAGCMGGGIWAAHFLGLLAFDLPISVLFDSMLMGVSIIPVIAISVLPMLVLGHVDPRPGAILPGAGLIGLCIGLMHHVGMLTVSAETTMIFEPLGLLLSIGVAGLFAALAMWLRQMAVRKNLNEWICNGVSAILIGLAATGAHHVGMSGTYLFNAAAAIAPVGFAAHAMAYAIGGVALLVLLVAINVTAFEHRLGIVRNALHSSEVRLQSVLDNMLDAVVTIDTKGVIRMVNPAVEKIFGYKPIECLGRNVSMFMGDDNARHHNTFVNVYMMTGQTKIMGKGRELVGVRQDGSAFPIYLGISEVEIMGERAFVGTIRDITARKTAESDLHAHREHLEETLDERTKELRDAVGALEEEVVERRKAENEAHFANRAKSEFLANMSHELRTPLNAVLGFSEIIERRIFGDRAIGRYSEYATDIRESGEHLLDIINDILDLAKIESGEMELEEGDFDPVQIVESCIRLTKEKARRADLTLTTDIDPNPVRLRCDERKLKQVLINLLANAIKFTPANGKIIVRTRPGNNGGFILEVEDTGIGIAQEDIAKVLMPFGQVDSALTRETAGTGLGLPLVKSLVELHNGTVELDSTPDIGTTVRVFLPSDRAEYPPTEKKPAIAG